MTICQPYDVIISDLMTYTFPEVGSIHLRRQSDDVIGLTDCHGLSNTATVDYHRYGQNDSCCLKLNHTQIHLRLSNPHSHRRGLAFPISQTHIIV